MTGELTNMQIQNVLSSRVIGRLACCDDMQPYIVPVTYVYDGTYIYGQSNEGLKLQLLRKNPNVCFEVDTMTDMRNWESVVIYGRFEELSGEDADKARAVLFGHIFTLKTSSTINPYGHEATGTIDDSTRIKQVMYRVKINTVTGRFEKQ
ncbi:pyridoxamine 5'-phosphate oxidase family protein [Ferruginibacter profundus]